MVEGAPAFRTALPFAGLRPNESLGQRMRTKGLSSPPNETLTTRRGARMAQMRRGILCLRRTAAAGGGGGNLHSELFGPRSPALSSNDRRRKRRSGRGAARKRRRDRSMTFGVVFYGVLAAP